MAFGWVEGDPQYSAGNVGQFSVENGVVTVDFTAANAGEGGTDAQFATFFSTFKTALTGAGFVVGEIRMSGNISKTLEEI